jgi:hypothetical protein
VNAPIQPVPGTQAPFPMAEEWETYKRELRRLLDEGHAGRHAVLQGTQVESIWDTYPDALQYAVGRFGRETRFAIKRIDLRDEKRLAIPPATEEPPCPSSAD